MSDGCVRTGLHQNVPAPGAPGVGRDRHPRRSRPARTLRRERGIALIIVLWLSILLIVIATGFAYDMRTEVLAARNAIGRTQARTLADGAIHRAFIELVKPTADPDRFQANGEPRQWLVDQARVAVSALDESGRIDLNTASEPLLRSAIKVLGQLSDEDTGRVLAAIQDWRDADDLTRPNGAEEPEYRANGRKYRPANQPFDNVEELKRVLGVSPELYQRLSGALTVYSRIPGLNSTIASRELLLAVPGATPETVDLYIQQRAEALEAKRPVPLFPPAAPFNSSVVQVWRIRAEVTLPDKVKFVREAVIRPAPDAKKMMTVFWWGEG